MAPEPEAAEAEPEPEESTLSDAELFLQVRDAFDRYVVLPKYGSTVATLWAVHTQRLDAARHSPRLVVTSPTYGCGKTLLIMDVLAPFTRDPLPSVNISAASLYRGIEEWSPTVLIDEFDSLSPELREALRNIVNAGHKRSQAGVVRCEPTKDGYVPTKFRVWTPLAIGMVGEPHRSIRSRSIVLQMHCKRPEEQIAPLLAEDERRLKELGAELATRAKRLNIPEDPKLPPKLDNRTADNWRPLIAIGDAIGGEWPRMARDTALALESGATARNLANDERLLLLADIRRILRREQVAAKGYIETKMLVSALQNLAERPWEHLTDRELGRRLGHGDGGFGAGPVNPDHRQIRDGKRKVRGWRVEWFSDCFARYLPPEADDETA